MRKFYDSTNVRMEGSFVPAPEGIYVLSIVKVTDRKDGGQWKTKNGDDYVSVECEISDRGDSFGKKIWYGVTFMNDPEAKGAGMSVHFLKSIGEPWEGKFEIDTDAWIGKKFKARVIVTKGLNGKPRNEVAWIIDGDEDSDEVPF